MPTEDEWRLVEARLQYDIDNNIGMDEKLYYDIFLDGYGCAILNIEEKNADQPKSKLETKIEGRTIKNAN